MLHVDLHNLEFVPAILVGIGLSAACGFRVFVPLLGLSIAAHTGYLQLSPEFAWLGSTPALVALTLATILEVGAYSVPFIDHMMDAITTPAAIVAGTLLMASMLGETSPFLKWSLAVIAGGGAAGIVQAGSMFLRGGSTILTGGSGNFMVAIFELLGAVAMTVLALLLPLLAVAGLAVIAVLLVRQLWRRFRGSAPPPSADSSW